MSDQPKIVCFDQSLKPVDSQVFIAVCYYDRGRGCWAAREVLAQKTGLSLASVGYAIARLEAGGYLRRQKRGRSPVMIFVDPKARQALGFFVPGRGGFDNQPVGGRRSFDNQPVGGRRSACTSILEKQEQQQRPVSDSDPEVDPVVVGGGVETYPGDTPSWPSLRPEVCRVADRLVLQGHPRSQVEAAVRYAEGKRGTVVNRPGLVRSCVEGEWDLPVWCFGPETGNRGGNGMETGQGVGRMEIASQGGDGVVLGAICVIDSVERRHLNARRARSRRAGGMQKLGGVLEGLLKGGGYASGSGDALPDSGPGLSPSLGGGG